jgi:two-component system, response regulator PdtaR
MLSVFTCLYGNEDPSLAARIPSAKPGSCTATPAILVVEDDPLLLLAAVEIVQEAGFEALVATTADEALSILEARADVRLVFTDVQMPGSMDGLRLAHAVRERWPPIELIVTSARSHIPVDDLPERAIYSQAL